MKTKTRNLICLLLFSVGHFALTLFFIMMEALMGMGSMGDGNSLAKESLIKGYETCAQWINALTWPIGRSVFQSFSWLILFSIIWGACALIVLVAISKICRLLIQKHLNRRAANDGLRRVRCWGFLISTIVVLSTYENSAAERDVPQAVMPARVLQLFLEANRPGSFTNQMQKFSSRIEERMQYPQSAATNAALFAIMQKIEWPDFSKMKRVRYRGLQKQGATNNLFQGYWLFYGEANQLIMLNHHMEKEWRIRGEISLEDADYGAELAELIGMLQTSYSNSPQQWDWSKMGLSSGNRTSTPMPIFYHALAAAWLGYTNQAQILLQQAIMQEGATLYFLSHVGTKALESFRQGLRLLADNMPRSQVVKQWELTVDLYGMGFASPPFPEYIAITKQQVEEFSNIVSTTVENPSSLPPAQRAEYYIMRFPETREISSGTMPTYGGKTLEDLVVELGREAVPACILHLNDRRLTRIYGPRGGSYVPVTMRIDTTVLRVQDLALTCIERITRRRFLDASKGSQLFSLRSPEDRADIVRAIETWWRENERKSDLAWRFERLGTMSLRERIAEVQLLEKLEPKATNYVALMKSWIGDNSKFWWGDLVRPLAERGDFSLMPRAREEWQRGQIADIALLLRFGAAKDFGHLRDAARKNALQYPEQKQLLYGNVLMAEIQRYNSDGVAPTNLFFVPLLVDALSYREKNNSTIIMGKFKKISLADAAMQSLIKMTGHNEGYNVQVEFEGNDIAIDQWLLWWKRSGEQEWLVAHPETKPAFGASEESVSSIKSDGLPELIPVHTEVNENQIIYELPREQVITLVHRGIVELKQFAGVRRFRFISNSDEIPAFFSAKPVRFTHSTYTNYIGQRRIFSSRPNLSSNSFLLPSMRFELSSFALPDSRGRTWIDCRGKTNALIVYDGKQRRVLMDYGNNAFDSGQSRWSFGFPLENGAMLLAELIRGGHKVHLFQDKEHVESPNLESLLTREANRMRKLLPFKPRPRGVGENVIFHVTKDGADDLWWMESGCVGVIHGTNKVIATRENFVFAGQTYFKFDWLKPLSHGVIIADMENMAILSFDGQIRLSRQYPLPKAALTHTGRLWPRFVPDEKGGVWISSQNSELVDEQLRQNTSFQGVVLFCDNDGGVWFRKLDSFLDVGLVRIAKNGLKSELRLPGINGSPCQGADETVWVVTQRGLVQVSYRNGNLKVKNEAHLSVGNVRIWCDDQQRLWMVDVEKTFGEPKVACFNVSFK